MRLSSRIRSLTIGIAVLLAATFARAQAPTATCSDWAAIQSFTGTITVSGSGQASDQNGDTGNVSENVTLTFKLATPDFVGNPCSSPAPFGFDAFGSQATYSVNMHDVFTSPSSQGSPPVPCTDTGTWDVANGINGFSGFLVGLVLDFTNQASPVYRIYFDNHVDGVTISHTGCGGSSSVTGSAEWGPGIDTTHTGLPTSFPLPAMVSSVVGNTSFPADAANVPLGTAYATWTISWNIAPAPPDLDVVVNIPNYSAWRPTAGLTENDTGLDASGNDNLLEIQAQLKVKSTGQPTTEGPDKWSFSLPGVSHEPGVAMNWPSMKDRANPSPPDLIFDQQVNQSVSPGISITQNGTLAEITNNPQPVATVFLSPRDWGGWANLNVTATVRGFPIKGHLQGDSATDILLPKRQPGSHIADVWKNDPAINVPLSTPDDDDSETDPDGLPGCIGDGLTLYEEYRGFMENGKHIEGDPHKKDFFIQNLMGGDGEPGIARFTALTHLNVHKDIQKSEMAGVDASGQLGDRIINFNHKDGAHQNFDQHGVVLAACFPAGHTFTDGGVTFLTQAGVRGRPGLTTGICMQSRDLPGRFLSPDNLHRSSLMPAGTGVITASDALLQYDVGVAHELSHSVGVEHHGDVDDNAARVFQLLPPNNPQNTTGQPVFQLNGQNVQLLPELGGPDAATTLWAGLQASSARCQAILANPSQNDPLVVESCQLLNQGIPYGFYVGLPHGKFSGDDRCVMRYFYAGAYPSASDSTAYYLVPAGTEPVGNALCNSPLGNPGGVNDPNRTIPVGHPQPRYFDAAATRGDCQHQVCVNDKYPPVPK